MANNTVYLDPSFGDDERRQKLYEGQLFVYSPKKASLALCALARELIEEAFSPVDPLTAQYELPVARFAEILDKVKPRFIHHPRAKQHLCELLAELGMSG